jgi:hypothetical protein
MFTTLRDLWNDPLCRVTACAIAAGFALYPMLHVLAWASVVIR